MVVRQVTDAPLHPDHVVVFWLRREVLEAPAYQPLHPGRFSPDVILGLVKKLLRLFEHVHFLEEGQEEVLGDAADATTAVQGSLGLDPLRPCTLKSKGKNGEDQEIESHEPGSKIVTFYYTLYIWKIALVQGSDYATLNHNSATLKGYKFLILTFLSFNTP